MPESWASEDGRRPQAHVARAIDPEKPLENWRSESALFLLSRRAEDRPEAVPTDLFGEVSMPAAEPAARPARSQRKARA